MKAANGVNIIGGGEIQLKCEIMAAKNVKKIIIETEMA
jgi:hypothetical protein